MRFDDQRNTLITELTNRTNQSVSHYQSLNDDDLAGAGAVLVFIRQAGIRTDLEIESMSDDDLRNTLIVEVNLQTGVSVPQLQGLTNSELVLVGLGKRKTYIRGALQIGRFRTYRQLNTMKREDQRNTLITELTNRTDQSVSHYQSLNDDDLAGAGAVLVFIRQAGIRDDAAIGKMSDDDLRNTLIVELAEFGGGQAHTNLELVRVGLTNVAFIDPVN
ncbi:hypothetical protein [Nocardia sp. NBC_01377]|uniref:hypothetical protein n=1 Tax=Nocardia sp. NBC_01377 TaxID=2903595 RepID=UPI003867DB24